MHINLQYLFPNVDQSEHYVDVTDSQSMEWNYFVFLFKAVPTPSDLRAVHISVNFTPDFEF